MHWWNRQLPGLAIISGSGSFRMPLDATVGMSIKVTTNSGTYPLKHNRYRITVITNSGTYYIRLFV